jgi:hypothetical protein
VRVQLRFWHLTEITDSKLGGWGLNMIKDSKSNRSEAVVRDQIGKVFLVVSTDGLMLRRCLICEGVFTREEAREHFRVACYPRT